MTTAYLKQKYTSLQYPTAAEIDFLFAEVERLERELAAAEKEIRVQRILSKRKY